MNFKAVVVTDGFDTPDCMGDLQSLLSARGIELISVPKLTMSEIEKLDQKVPHLFFKNPYTRFSGIPDIIEFYTRLPIFTTLQMGNEMVAFIPEMIVAKETSTFNVTNADVYYQKPSIDPTTVIVTTHKRHAYLELTLNALLYSLRFDPTPVVIVMSAPTEQVEALVDRYIRTYANITALKFSKNLGLSGSTAGVACMNPKKFTILEEDFILSPAVQCLVPFWTRQFSYRLDHFDLVAFRTSLENRPYSFIAPRLSKFILKEQDISQEGLWSIMRKPFEFSAGITGNTLSMNTAWHNKQERCPQQKVLSDGKAVEFCNSISLVNIPGYHIGWNQEMDGGASLNNLARFPIPDAVQECLNINTGEKYLITM